VTLLILEHACLFYGSLSKPTANEALEKAYSQYQASDVHDAVMKSFPAPPREYSIKEYTEFILTHHF
jgi:hypothetical protein